MEESGNPALAGEAELEARARRWYAEQPMPVYPALRQALVFLVFYLVLGVISFSSHRGEFKDWHGKSVPQTHLVVDGLYFTVSILSRVGYGDFSPQSPATKVFCCLYALVGVGFIQILFSRALGLVMRDVERRVLDRPAIACFVIDARTGRFSEKVKMFLAFVTLVLCIGVGALLIWMLEGRDFRNSVYMSIISVTTVGFGDMVFTTVYGRLFGSLWLFISTMVALRCFLAMIEARIRLEEEVVKQEAKAHFARLDASSVQGDGFMEGAHLSRPSQGRLVRRSARMP